MSYVVLARKWRPKQFDEVVGQEHVARTLKNAILQDRVAHAFLFTGARGVGKTSTARILAKALNCQAQNGATPTPCDVCDSCKEVTSGQSVDVFEIDGASNRGINEIRELRESVRYAPSRGRTKIYIIDEVHMLTTEAFNALLKTLEEPPSHVKFVFATTEPQKIPVTILSRCQRYDFKRIGQNDIVRHLELLCGAENIKAEKPALQIIARQAAGGMRDALSLLDQIISFAGNEISEASVQEILGVANRSHLFDLSAGIIARDVEKCLLTLDEIHRFGYDMLQFATEFVTHFRDLMVLSVVKDPERVTNLTSTEIDDARAQIQGVSTELLHRYFALTAATVPEMARSQFPKMHFELMLVRMAQLEPMIGMDLLIDRLTALEAEFDGEPMAPVVQAPSSSAPRHAAIPRTPEASVLHKELPPEPVKPEPVKETEPEPEAVQEPEPAQVSEPKPEPVQASEPVLPEPETEAAQAVETEPPHIESKQLLPTESEPVLEQSVPEPIEPEFEAELPIITDQEAAAPDRHAIAAIDPLSLAEIASMTPYQRWTRVVDEIRVFNKPVAATCEYGYPERFADHVVELSFVDKYMPLITETNRRETLELVLKALFGDEWAIDLQLNSGTPAVQSIAEEKDALKAKRKADLVDEVTNNPVVGKAKELFEVDEESVKVQVRLFEEM